MGLELKFDIANGKTVKIGIDEKSVSIDSNRPLTMNELHYISSVMFIYLGSEARGIPLDLDYLLDQAYELYEKVQYGKFHGLQLPEDMTTEEFNEFMRN